MSIPDEEIMAYVDGEMDEEARGRVTLAALSDLDLAERIAAQRALRERLRGHYAPVAQAPVPEEWVAAIRRAAPEPAQVIDLAAARAEREAARAPSFRPWYRPAWAGAAMAACLMLGIFVGTQWQGDSTPIRAAGGALVAAGPLGKALDNQLAFAQDGAPVRMLGTFRREGGDVCRVFSGAMASGIACRDGGQWRLEHVLPGAGASSAAYRQAGSQEAELMALAQNMAGGEPFDAAQEKASKEKGWK